MFKLNYPLVILGTGILMLACSTLFAQLAYSPFTEGAVAYVALTGSEINFARGNPASLAHSPNMKKVIYSIETNQDHFDSHIQNFGLKVAVNSRLTIGVGGWCHIATTGAM